MSLPLLFPRCDARLMSCAPLVVTLTTVSGVLNLLTTGWLMRNYGVRAALINQTAWPCLRNLCQILGIIKGGTFGIVIFQLTQTITALGGGAGYLLAANSFVAAVVDPEERTACFGQLQGVAMAGTAVAFTIGGVLGDTFGLVSPFAFTFCLLVFSTILSRFALPYIAPEATESKDGDGKVGSRGVWGGIKSFFKPLKVFAPRKLRSLGGKTYYGVTLLAVGNFISVLATAYVPLMLQLISTNLYAFGPSKNGYLMSTFALCRAVFLTFAFPQIIKYGRAWYNKGHAQSQDLDAKKKKTRGGASERSRLIDGEDSGDDTSETAAEDEDSSSDDGAKTRSGHHHSGFDLVFLRISILVDACLTACVAFADRGWQMYLAAAILPLASGTAAASKGVVMEMVTPEQKPDALSAVSLVELTATVTTVSIFGAIFAYLSEQGKPNVVFVLNGVRPFRGTMGSTFFTRDWLTAVLPLFARFYRPPLSSPQHYCYSLDYHPRKRSKRRKKKTTTERQNSESQA